MNKFTTIIIVIAVIALLPFLLVLRTKPLDFERVEDAFQEDSLSVTSIEGITPTQYNATAQTRMRVNAADVDVFMYKDQKSLDKALKTIEKAATKASSSGAAAGGALGPMKAEFAINKLYVLIIRSRNEQVRARVLYLFQTL